jgi:hypothetical protein
MRENGFAIKPMVMGPTCIIMGLNTLDIGTMISSMAREEKSGLVEYQNLRNFRWSSL